MLKAFAHVINVLEKARTLLIIQIVLLITLNPEKTKDHTAQ